MTLHTLQEVFEFVQDRFGETDATGDFKLTLMSQYAKHTDLSLKEILSDMLHGYHFSYIAKEVLVNL